jgi:molecular chaperone DnaK
MAKDNKTIGRFHLDGIPPAPRGIPQVEVTFDIDANGILNVSAKDKGTGKEQNIRIEASSGLTDEEINKMKEEAKANADSDQKEREKIDKINTADGLIFQTEKQLKEFGDKLSKPNKKAIQDSLDKLKSIHKEEKIDEIDSAIEALNKSWEAASQEMYKATQEQQGAPDQKTPAGNKSKGKNKNDDISDVDFEEVKEEKK